MPDTLPHQAQDTAVPSEEARWHAVLDRDPSFDGAFYYSVASTGVYCRPSCPARRPARAHVRFHDTAEAAEEAGFRACKRCKPDQPSLQAQHGAKVAHACRLIEAAETPPPLAVLADAVGLSPYHFHRLFKTALGVTPKAYATAHRNKRVRAALGRSTTVTQAIYDAGFNANSRFYANASEVLGMTPRSFHAGGTDRTIAFAFAECSLGLVLIAASEAGVCAILFGDTQEGLRRELEKQFPRARLVRGDADFETLTTKVIGLIENPGSNLEVPLDIRGTAFQHRVWDALRHIPVGSTASYTEIAEIIGAPKSARAVARACASNPIAVAIPCHRVVRSDGSLSGYRGGVDRKRALLAKERSGR
jgi:AraC family transcriptional regulator, regulatory protein of adaptative response / methylated-DNA-[protein]-cysteine methyltransferase